MFGDVTPLARRSVQSLLDAAGSHFFFSSGQCDMADGLPPPSIKIGEYFLKFEQDELGEEYEERARKELRETPEVVNGALIALKDLLRSKELRFLVLVS
jgi:hypothetical protein